MLSFAKVDSTADVSQHVRIPVAGCLLDIWSGSILICALSGVLGLVCSFSMEYHLFH